MKKTGPIAKVILLSLFLTVFLLNASAQKVTLSFQNENFEKVLNAIKQQTGLSLVFSEQLVDLNRKVNINVNSIQLQDALKQLLTGTNLGFEIKNNKLYFVEKKVDKSKDITVKSKKLDGLVTDDKGDPIIGASVKVSGTSVGTITDINGKFNVNVTESDKLAITYIGYLSQQVTINEQNNITVILKENNKLLDEVIVVAYGVQKKSDLTSSISVVDAKSLSEVAVTNVAQAIQGKVPGVTVTSDGSPGSSGSIRIRGVGTINNTQPLTVVDGIPGAPMPDVNNIQSLQILKDAAACALYGSRGSNGIILITTKKGVKGETRINYNGYSGWQWVNRKIEMLNSEEYIQFHQENQLINNLGGVYSNGWVTLSPRIQQAIDDPTTINHSDWQSELFKPAFMTKHNISASGGGENNNFYFSGSYTNQDGIQKTSNYKNIDIQINNGTRIGALRIGQNLNVYSQSRNNTDPLSSILRQSPLVPIYNISNLGGFDGATDNMDLTNDVNPIATIYLSPSESNNVGLSGNVYVEFDCLNNFTFRSNVAERISNSDGKSTGITGMYGTVNKSYSTMSMSLGKGFNSAIENTLTFKKNINKHNINAMIGYTWEYSHYENMTGSADKFNVRIPVSFATVSTDAISSITGSYSETAMESLLGRVMYDYEGRYMFTGNFRRDGSSKFGRNYRYGNFPSFSAGWRLSEEPFMEKTKSYIDNLKFRASWGVIGSDFGITAYNQELILNQNLKYVFDNKVAPATTISNIVNEDLRWEEQSTINLGVDIDLFNGKLSFITDYFYKKTNGMLISIPIAYSNGVSSLFMNAGDIKNTGGEFTVIGRKNKGKFQCEGTFNITIENNKVLKLGNINQPIRGGITNQFPEGITITKVGQAIGQFYGYKMLGIYQIGDKDIPTGVSPGDIRYDDMIDGKSGLTADDRTVIGSPFPDFTYNFGINASYKDFDLSIFFQGVEGNSIFNENLYWLEGMKDFRGFGAEVLNRWTPNNPSNVIPRATQNTTYNLKISDRFIENGSYLRLKTITLGYNVSDVLLKKLKFQKLRIYATAQNLLTLTKYSGYDPEISNGAGYSWQKDNNLYNGIDRNNYPVSASAFVGLEIGF